MFGEKDNRFFYLFETAAANVAGAARILELITNHPEEREAKTAELEKMEHVGDEMTHDIIKELNKVFITPIDREDIFLLAKEIDNVIDAIEATAYRYVILDIKEVTPAARRLAEMIVQSADELTDLMRNFRRLKQIAEDNSAIVEINRIEDEGDTIYRQAVRELYAGCPDPLTVIRWREIYDYLEEVLDKLEDVANIIEGIAMKHS